MAACLYENVHTYVHQYLHRKNEQVYVVQRLYMGQSTDQKIRVRCTINDRTLQYGGMYYASQCTDPARLVFEVATFVANTVLVITTVEELHLPNDVLPFLG